MDDLMNTLMERQQPAAQPITTPTQAAHTPPAWQRFATAQKMMDSYRNGWNPNPLLTRIQDGK